MANTSGVNFDVNAPFDDDEDEQCLAAIDEGIRDAEAGRTLPQEDVRKLLPQWITASSTRKQR
jgi:predicted transcriptional regulator